VRRPLGQFVSAID